MICPPGIAVLGSKDREIFHQTCSGTILANMKTTKGMHFIKIKMVSELVWCSFKYEGCFISEWMVSILTIICADNVLKIKDYRKACYISSFQYWHFNGDSISKIENTEKPVMYRKI